MPIYRFFAPLFLFFLLNKYETYASLLRIYCECITMYSYSLNRVANLAPSVALFRQFGSQKFKGKMVQYLVAAVLGKAWESC